jgi:equilibrative nucleoside transporter 1/2/3
MSIIIDYHEESSQLLAPSKHAAEADPEKLTPKVYDHEDQGHEFLFTLMGIAYLFPYLALTQPVDYWRELYPDENIDFYIQVVYTTTNLVLVTFFVFSGFFANKNEDLINRIYYGTLGQAASLALVGLSYYFPLGDMFALAVILFGTFTAAAATSLVDSALFGFTGLYPSDCMISLQVRWSNCFLYIIACKG